MPFDSYQDTRSFMRAFGKTNPWEQQPNLGTPSGIGSIVTRPAAKKRIIKSGVQMQGIAKMVSFGMNGFKEGV
jgi:hypothetical protein